MENQKNNMYGVLSLFLLVTTVLLVYSVFWGPFSEIGNSFPSRTLSVSASGKVVAKPNVAFLSFSVVSEGVRTQVVSDENNKRMQQVSSFLKEQDIDEKDIETTEYNLQPVYTQRGEGFMSTSFVPTIAKYTLTQTTRVKVRDFSKISSVMDGVLSRGANRFHTITFAVDDPEQFLAQARSEAFEQARAKAVRMAQDAGVLLGRAVSVNEYGDAPYPMYDSMSANMDKGGAGTMLMSAPVIDPGSDELRVNVNVVYEIR